MKEFFKHFSGLKVSRDGEVLVPQSYTHPEHYTYGSKLGDGHLKVCYNRKEWKIHRVVAEVFLNDNKPLPKGYDVHHCNGNKTDNKVENLMILTRKEHISLHHKGKTNSVETRRRISKTRIGKCGGEKHPMYGKFGAEHQRAIPVIGVNKTTYKKIEFGSVADAERTLGIKATHISACCRGKKKSAGGWMWQYA